MDGRSGSVSERAELRLQGARQARLAGLARRVGWDWEWDRREKQDVREEREKLRQVDPSIRVAPVSQKNYVCDPI